jgi:hypothetical protein
MVSYRLQPNSSPPANPRYEFRSMRQTACVCSAAVRQPEVCRQELSKLLLFPEICMNVWHMMFLGIPKEHTDQNSIKH